VKLLAIDTVTEACSVALWVDGELTTQEALVYQGHAERVLPMVEALLAQTQTSLSQLDAIVFDRGPGSFTGLRIGAGVTQGLALGIDRPVIPVSSLATLAQGAWRLDQQTQVLACIDARQSEVYWAGFRLQDDVMQAITEECLSPAQRVLENDNRSWFGVGTGFGRYPNELAGLSGVTWLGVQQECYPRAQDMLPLALAAWRAQAWVQPADAIPIYLRDNVATPPTK
jgi:tRNA threonylcarbamoyladenosine biosynthesis protein TsaB